MLLPLMPLAAMGVEPPDPEWSVKKAMLRDRLRTLQQNANAFYQRNDPYPGFTMERKGGTHGAYDYDWDRITLDLESVQNRFWHVYNETLAHEYAHRLNGLLNDSRGHGEGFEGIFQTLREQQ